MSTPISSLPVTTTPQDKDWSAFAAGQPFTMEHVRQMVNRDPYAQFLTYGLPEKALGLGFEVITDDDEPIDDWEAKWKLLEPEWKKVVESGAGYARSFGRSIIVLAKSDNPQETGRPFLKIFEPILVEKTEYYNDMSIKSIKIKDRDPNSGQDIPLDINGPKTDNVYEIIQRVKQYPWEAGCYLEPVWDELIGLRLIRSGATLYAIRVGAGLRVVKIPPGTDPDTVEEIKANAKKIDSLNGWFLIPIDEAEVTIETGQGMVDYDALKQALLGSLATYTGYPKAGFEGIEMERQGGTFNEERVTDCERVIQRRYKDVAKWLTLHFSDYYGWDISEESFRMRYVRREIVNEREQEEIDEIKARTDQTLINAGIKSADEARKEWGYKGPAPERPSPFNIKVKGLNDEGPPGADANALRNSTQTEENEKT